MNAPGPLVLVVEDEAQVRQLVREILARKGYVVLDAPGPAEALALSATHAATIHLLLTDLVMPGLNGRQLAERVLESRPDVRVLYMSGYPGGVIAERGVLEEDAEFLAKPITPAALLAKVGEVLGTSHP